MVYLCSLFYIGFVKSVWCFHHWQGRTTIGQLVVGNMRFRLCPALGLHLNKHRTEPLCCLCWFGAEFFCDVWLVDSTIGSDVGEPFTIVKKPKFATVGTIRTTVVVHAKNIVYYERFQFHSEKRMENRWRSSLCTTTSQTGPETYVNGSSNKTVAHFAGKVKVEFCGPW